MTFAELAMCVLCAIDDERDTDKLPNDVIAHAAYDLGYAAAVRRMRVIAEAENANNVETGKLD